SAFADLLPKFAFKLDSRRAHWGIFGLNRALPRGIRVRNEPPPNAKQEPKLTITLDRVTLLASKRRMQKVLREASGKAFTFLGLARPRQFGLKLEVGWHKAPLDKPLVLVVPGFQANADNTDALASAFRKQHLLVGAFHYPNDQPIEESAQLLARELRRL